MADEKKELTQERINTFKENYTSIVGDSLEIAEAIDATRNKICAEDEVYQQDEKDLDELTKRFMELDLPEHDRMIINDYIACLQTVDLNYSRNSI